MNKLLSVYANDIKRNDIFIRGNNGEDNTFKIVSIDKTSIKDYVYITNRQGDTIRLSRLCLWRIKQAKQ
jgi:hypothetical protein